MATERIDISKLSRVEQRKLLKEMDKKLASPNDSDVGMGEDGHYTDIVDPEKLLGKKEVEPITEAMIAAVYPIKVPPRTLKKAADAMNMALQGMGDGLEEFYRENLIGLIDVAKSFKRFSFEEYSNAVKFVTYRQAGDTCIKAFAKTFPDKIQRMHRENIPNNYLQAYAGIYAKSKLVSSIQAMLILPAHIMYQDVFHKAVQTQMQLMLDDSVSPKTRSDAANSLMTHLKQPEIKQMEVQVGIKESNVLEQFKEAMAEMAKKQHDMILEGDYSVVDVSAMNIYSHDKDNLSNE